MRLVDEHNGVKSWFEYDDLTDQVTIKTTQDMTPFLEHAKRARSEGKHRSKDKSLSYQGSVPHAIWLKWFQEEGLVFASIKDVPREERRRIYKKKLNGEYSAFKASEGTF